ncbi:hypothetical protein C0995_012496 [Termitomyces sp. Mi166|nr:hypothetical protein C0995_012496 [Termitomyces sp. Mi166\
MSGSASLSMARTLVDGVDVNQANETVYPCWAEVIRAGDAHALHVEQKVLTSFMKDKNSQPFHELRKSPQLRPHTEHNNPPSPLPVENAPLEATVSPPGLPQWPPAGTTTVQKTSYISPPRRRTRFALPIVDEPAPARATSDTTRPSVGRLPKHTRVMHALQEAYASPHVGSVRRNEGRARGANTSAPDVTRTDLAGKEPIEDDAMSDAGEPLQEPRPMTGSRNHVARETGNGEQARSALNNSANLRGFGFTLGVSFSFRYDHY